MADLFRSCPDGHRCENDALCAESAEGSYYCNCAGDFVGLSCEFAAQNYCQASGETVSTWFCANQGTCVRSSSFWTCDCPAEYEGSRCEYIAGAKPSDWPTFELRRGGAAKDEGLKVGVTVTIVLVTLIVGLMMGFLVVRSIRRRRSGKEELDGSFPTFRKAGQNAPKDPSEALNIEMDGSGFRETIFSSVTKGSGNYSFEVDSEMGTPKQAEIISYNDDVPPPPPPPASPPHENGRQHGMVGGSARPSWGGQML